MQVTASKQPTHPATTSTHLGSGFRSQSVIPPPPHLHLYFLPHTYPHSRLSLTYNYIQLQTSYLVNSLPHRPITLSVIVPYIFKIYCRIIVTSNRQDILMLSQPSYRDRRVSYTESAYSNDINLVSQGQ